MKRWVLLGLGILFDLIGIVWVLQGTNVLPGSFMTGQVFWAGAGAALLITGIVLVMLALRHHMETS
jgi:hypothetical protein